jgi:polyhydroxyalkanoate synthesis repressor PhaR
MDRIIKRYVNRKLYDTELSHYVTIEEVAEHIKNGVSVKIVDNKTGEDITSTTLLQIILEAEKKNRIRSSSSILESVIKTGTLSEFLHTYSSSFKSGLEEAEDWLSKIADGNQRFWNEIKEQIRSKNNNNDSKKFEEYGKRMENYYRSTIEKIKYTTNREKTKAERELINLRQKLSEMENKLKEYEEDEKRRNTDD